MDLTVIILLSLVSYSYSVFDLTNRCLLFRNKCISHCPRMMHAYHTRCDGQTLTQRTCTNPEVWILGYTCGWSRCDCNGDLVLDEESGLCMPWQDCPIPLARKYRRRKGKDEGGFRLSKRVRIPSEDPDTAIFRNK